MQIPK